MMCGHVASSCVVGERELKYTLVPRMASGIIVCSSLWASIDRGVGYHMGCPISHSLTAVVFGEGSSARLVIVDTLRVVLIVAMVSQDRF